MKSTIQELKRRGYLVTKTADDGLLVEKDNWWGKFSYDTGAGIDRSSIKWGRTVLLTLVYFAGIVGGIYWLWRKGEMRKEVLSLTSGK